MGRFGRVCPSPRSFPHLLLCPGYNPGALGVCFIFYLQLRPLSCCVCPRVPFTGFRQPLCIESCLTSLVSTVPRLQALVASVGHAAPYLPQPTALRVGMVSLPHFRQVGGGFGVYHASIMVLRPIPCYAGTYHSSLPSLPRLRHTIDCDSMGCESLGWGGVTSRVWLWFLAGFSA